MNHENPMNASFAKNENNNVDYSTREPDKYNNNQHCIVLSFENERDRTIVLNAMFTNDIR